MLRNLEYGSNRIKEILKDVTVCTQLYCLKDGKVYSPLAEEYLNWLKKYTKYCIPEEISNWEYVVRKTIYSPLILKHSTEMNDRIKEMIATREYAIIDTLFNFMDAGDIMELYENTNSWEKVHELLSEQGHTGYTFSGVCNIMLQYSPYGPEFIEKFAMSRVERDENFRKKYEEAKLKQEERKKINKELISVLKRQLSKGE